MIVTGAAVLAVVAAAAIAGPLIYRDLVAGQAASAPTLSAKEGVLGGSAVGDALEPSAVAGEWTVSEGSEAGYRVNEVLNGTDVTVTGRTSDVRGTFTISEDGKTLSAARIEVDVASIQTDSSSRDSYFRDNALRTAEHPTATFTLTKPVTLAETPKSGDAVQATAVGDLSIAGTTRSVEAAVQVQSDGSTGQLAGSIPITFADFGVEAPDLGFVKVEPKGAVEFQLNVAH
nr:YceI family protein [Leucobacter edaphi]